MKSKLIREGSSIPAWYGVAYSDPVTGQAVCYWLGIHLLVRWGLAIWFAFKIPNPAWWEKRFREIRNQAWREAFVAGQGSKIDGKTIFSKSQMRRIKAQAFHLGQSELIKNIENRMDARAAAARIARGLPPDEEPPIQ